MPSSARNAAASSPKASASSSFSTSSRGSGTSAPFHATVSGGSSSAKVRSKPVIAGLVRVGESGPADTAPG